VLTDAGRAVLAAALPAWRREHAALDGLLGGTEANRMRAGLTALS
jgi:hypothetical protein